MAILKDEGFVLNRIPLRETSLISTLFCKRAGKIKLLIKGVRREKRLRMAAFEPFTRVRVVYYEKVKSDLHLCSDVAIVASHAELRSQLQRMSYTAFMAELVDTVFRAHDPHEDVFDLIGVCFRLMSQYPAELVTRIFEVKLLHLVGWLPILTECVVCQEQVLHQVFFSPRQGGILCPSCDRSEAQTTPISNGTRQSLHYFATRPILEAVRLMVPKLTATELERVTRRFLGYHLEYPMKSTKFLAELASISKV